MTVEEKIYDLTMDLKSNLEDVIGSFTLDEEYYLYSEYCQSASYYDDEPYPLEAVNELFCGLEPLEIVEKLEGINTSWSYFKFDGYGWVEEWNGIDDYDEIIEYIVDNDDALNNDEIRELLDDYNSAVDEIDDDEDDEE